MTLEEALIARQGAQNDFEKAFRQKIQDIKVAYSRENLNEKQLAFLHRDETFCKTTECLFNILIAQVSFLKQEIEQQQHFMSDMQKDMTFYQELFINLCREHNQLKQKVSPNHFSFLTR